MSITSNDRSESLTRPARKAGHPNHLGPAPYPTMNRQLLEWQTSCTNAALDLCSGDKRSLRSVLMLIQYAARFASTKGTLDDGRQFCEMSRRQLASELGWSQGRVTRALTVAEPFLRRITPGEGSSPSVYEFVGILPVEGKGPGEKRVGAGPAQNRGETAVSASTNAEDEPQSDADGVTEGGEDEATLRESFRQFLLAFGAGCGKREADTFVRFCKRVDEGFAPRAIIDAAKRYRTEPLPSDFAQRWRYPLKFLDDDRQFPAYCRKSRQGGERRTWSLSRAKVTPCIERSQHAVVVYGPSASQTLMIDLPESLRGADEGTVRNWLIRNHEDEILREFGIKIPAA